jgi:hypothetical protein
MTYTLPTAAEFLARFPAFGELDEDYVTALLTEASRYVDDTWLTQADYTSGALYAAAHLIATDNALEGEAVDTGDRSIQSESWGSMSVSYGKDGSAGGTTLAAFNSTGYGRRFLEIVRLNKPGVVAI